MSGNYLPWLLMGAAVLITLYLKGYIGGAPRLPGISRGATAHDLGVAYHKALHAEAMSDVYDRMARDRDELIKERVAAPFSPPDPAGPEVAGATTK